MKRAIFIAVFFVLFSQVCVGQWEKMPLALSLDSGERAYVISFADSSGIPLRGVVGVYRGTTLSRFDGRLVYTTNGGTDWFESTIINTPESISKPGDIVFINKDIGWATFGTDDDEVPLCQTLDGGKTWQTKYSDKGGTSLYYHKDKGVLFWGSWGKSYTLDPVSGAIITTFPFGWRNGLAFISPEVGIWTPVGGGCERENQWTLYTTDSGTSWQQSNVLMEAWQPVSVPDSNIFLAATDFDATILRSEDSGKSWTEIYRFTTDCSVYRKATLSGCIRRMGCNLLVVQSIDSGLFISKDGGYSWKGIGGPGILQQDTRFYTNDNYIIAGGKVGENFESSLWKLDIRTLPPEITPQILSVSSNCNGIDTVIRLERYMSCEDSTGFLLGASIAGGTGFQIVSPDTYPYILQSSDNIRIRYTPIEANGDTAYLHLRFSMNNTLYDTTITLIGNYNDASKPSSTLYLSSSTGANSTITDVGRSVEVYIKTRQLIPISSSIQTVTFDLDFNPSVLTVSSIRPSPSWIIENQLILDGHAELTLRKIAGGDIAADSIVVVVEYSTTIGDRLSSLVTLDERNITSSPLSLGCSSISVLISNECGNNIISEFLRTKRLGIVSVYPNPSKDMISLELEAADSYESIIEVVDILGNVVVKYQRQLCSGRQAVPLQTEKLLTGNYILRVSSSFGVSSARFVKQ